MIDGADGFRYLGMLRRGKSAVLVFREGTLTVDFRRSGWGIMRRTELQRALASDETALARVEDEWSSESSFEYDSDEASAAEPASHSDSRSVTTTSSSSSSRGNSRSASPERPAANPDDALREEEYRRFRAPPDDTVGWYPSRTPVGLYPCTQMAMDRARLAKESATLDTLIEAVKAGTFAPDAADPAVGLFLALDPFGTVIWQTMLGTWCAADDAFHVRIGLTADKARRLVAGARLVAKCDLAPVQNAQMKRYRGAVGNEHVQALVFKDGLVVKGPDGDPLNGWHAITPDDCGRLTCAPMVRALEDVCAQPFDPANRILRRFRFAQELGGPEDHLVVLSWSAEHDNHLLLDIPAPNGLVRPDEPHGVPESRAREVLQAATWAPARDPQRITGFHSLNSGKWRVPVLLSAMRLLTLNDQAPGMLRDTWHATLCPPLEHLLTCIRPREAEALEKAVIDQPIDSLLDLMHRDVRLRRREVTLRWPADWIAFLFETLAPKVHVAVVMRPDVATVDKLLVSANGLMLVFESINDHRQSAVVVRDGMCWEGDQWLPLEQLHLRLHDLKDDHPGETLVALVSLV